MPSSLPSRFDVVRIQFAVITCFFVVGLSLGALPLFISDELGASDSIVGMVIGAQFLASLGSRVFVGRLLRSGARRCVAVSLGALALYGALLALGGQAFEGTVPLLVAARIVQGVAVGTLITAAIVWTIDKLGESSTARVLAMTGISIYGAVACGAPVGIVLFKLWGLAAAGGVAVVVALLALAALATVTDEVRHGEQKAAGGKVFGKVLVPGAVLFLHGVGFVSIEAFVSLYFAASGWSMVTVALSLFGLSFVAVRLSLGHLLQGNRLQRLAALSLACQALGLVLLALAPNQYWALLFVALVGGSCSLTFPALGTLAAGRCSPHERGTAMAFYAGFQDASYALTGPVIGLVIQAHGYGTGFFAAGLCALGGLVLLRRARP